MKKNILTVIIALVSATLTAQTVNIPDANFKAYLLKIYLLDKDKDGEIQIPEAAAYKGSIIYKNNASKGVDLTGLEAFTSITKLEINANGLTSLDVSKNTELTSLICFKNSIKTLDLSKNTKITKIHCYYNSLTDLKIGSLDVLTSLRCYNNALKSIDVTGATKLDELFCHTNQLTSLITDGATSLAKIVSYTNTSLTNLDLSTNTGLTQLWTYNCNLGYLNVANGNNSNMADWQFQISKNANLTCVQVDDVDYSAKTWTDKDPAATFSLKCKNTVSIAHLSTIKINIYPNPCTGKLNIEGVKLIKEVQVINAIGKEVYRISNPSQFIDIKHLNNGMYFMLIHSEKGLSSHKIQVKH